VTTPFVLTDTNSDLTTQGSVHNKKAPAAAEGGTSLDITLAGGGFGSAAWYTEPSVPNLTEWPAGPYTLSLDIDATGADITYTLSLRQVNSAGTPQATLGTSGTLSGTGLKSHTVNVGAPFATNAGDRFVGVLTAVRGASHGNQTLTISVNGANDQLIGAWTEAAPEHVTTGVLAGPGSTIDGAAARTREHATDGALTAAGAMLDGAASRQGAPVSHATTGELAGAAALVDGTAARTRVHATDGTLAGPGSTLDGAAARTRAHATNGVLAAQGAVIEGTAARVGAPPNHATTGALEGPGASLDGTADRQHEHPTTGTLAGAGSTVDGTAARTRVHATDGVLAGQAAALDGAAARTRAHATDGVLEGQGSTLDGTAARVGEPVEHSTSGSLVGQGAQIIGDAARPAPIDEGIVGFVPMPMPRRRLPVQHVARGRLHGRGAKVRGMAHITPTGQNRLALLLIAT
jgi:hypothetical protein